MQRLPLIVALTLSLLLGACGFHLRGEAGLPFSTLYVAIADGSQFGAEIKQPPLGPTSVCGTGT